MRKASREQRVAELRHQLEQLLNEDRLEAAVDTTTKAAVATGAGTLGATIWSSMAEDAGSLVVASMLGRVFNGFIVVDVVLGLVLLHKRMKKRKEQQPITLEATPVEEY